MFNSLFAFPPKFSFLKDSQNIKIVRGHLFFTCEPHPSFPYSPLLRVLDVRHILIVVRTRQQKSPTATAQINVDELEFTELHFKLPNGFKADGAVLLPSLCSFHWKEEQERYEQLTVEIPAMPVEPGSESMYRGYFVNRYSFTPRKSYHEPPMLDLISSCKIFSSSYHYFQHTLSHFIPCSISGRSIMRLSACEIRNHRQVIVTGNLVPITTIDESSADVNDSQGQQAFSFRFAPQWLSLSSLYKVDYLSGAVINILSYDGRIKITYPA